MAAMESASSCGPQANSQPEPPRAQAPKPTEVILRSELPNFRVSIQTLSSNHAKIRQLRSQDYRSEEHTSELQSHLNLVCRLLLEKKKNNTYTFTDTHAVIT